MAYYYVNKNKQENGDQEVHKLDCPWVPLPENRLYQGDFTVCSPAVKEAKNQGHSSVNGCYFCCNDYHTT